MRAPVAAFMVFMSIAVLPTCMSFDGDSRSGADLDHHAVLIDRNVFVRERANGLYGPFAYATAYTLISIPGLILITSSGMFNLVHTPLFPRILPSAAAAAIVYWMVGLHSEFTRFVWFNLDLFLSLLVAEGLMLFISACVPYFIVGLAVGAGIYGMFMLCEGFFVLKARKLEDQIYHDL